MQSCPPSSEANVYKSGLFDSYYPCPVYGYPWVDSRNLSVGEWDLSYPQDAYGSYCSGLDYNLHGIVKTPVDMNSLKDAIYDAEAGTGEVEDIIMSCKFRPREAAFTKLIVTCGRWQDSQKALEVFHAMTQKRGIKPNTITYTALISACSSSGNCETAMQVFRDMKRAAITDSSCRPNEVTYNKIITASECGGFYEFAVSCYLEMTEQGIEGDRAVYCSALHSCLQTQTWKEAEAILSLMHEKRFSASLANYAAMITYYGENGELANAVDLFVELQELEQKVDQRCCHALMRAFEVAEEADMAMKLVTSMWDAGIQVEMPTYISALRVYALTGQWRHTLATIKTMATEFDSFPEEAKNLILTAVKSSNKKMIVKRLEDVFNNDAVEGASSSSSSE